MPVRIMIYTGPSRIRAVRVFADGSTHMANLAHGDEGTALVLADTVWPRLLRAGVIRAATEDEERAVREVVYGEGSTEEPEAPDEPDGDDLDEMSRAELWRLVKDAAGDAMPFSYVGTDADEMRDWLREHGDD